VQSAREFDASFRLEVPAPRQLKRDEIRLILLRRRCAPSPVCDLRGRGPFRIVMAGLVPAIHVVANRKKGVDARVKPGHDESVGRLNRKSTSHVAAKIHDSSHAELAARSLLVAALASTAAEVYSLPLKGGGLGWGSDFRSRKRERSLGSRTQRFPQNSSRFSRSMVPPCRSAVSARYAPRRAVSAAARPSGSSVPMRRRTSSAPRLSSTASRPETL